MTHCDSEKLRDSKYGNEEDINSMVEHFDISTKPTFKDPAERSYVKFGSMRDKDPAVGIKGGQLQLSGYTAHIYALGYSLILSLLRQEVESLFKPSISAIIDAVHKQCDSSSKKVKVS